MKIGIVGAHPGTRLAAPYRDEGWTIWACSFRNVGELPRWDLWFELHDPPGHDKYIAWLAKQPNLMVRTEKVQSLLPNAQVYPEVELRKVFGPFFFTSSIAYMLAMALSHDPTDIGLWGVGMHKREEYEYQRPGCHHFIQAAWDRGINVIAADATLLQPPDERW